MDYFSELLTSFESLKKRTYKLTFINEADAKEPDPPADPKTLQAAIGIVKQGLGSAPQAQDAAGGMALQDTAGNQTNVKVFSKTLGSGEVASYLFFSKGKGPPSIYKAISNGVENTEVINAAAEVLAKGAAKSSKEDAAAVDAEVSAAQSKAQAEADIKEKRKEIDGIIETNNRPDCKRVGVIMSRIQKALEKAKVSPRRHGTKGLSGVRVKELMLTYTDRLTTGIQLEVEDVASGKTRPVPVDANTAEECAQSLANFFHILEADPDDENQLCEKSTKSVSMYKGELVAMNKDGSDGIVVTKNKNLHVAIKSSMELYEKLCGTKEDDWGKLTSNIVATNTKNAVKGTFFETLIHATVLANKEGIKAAASMLLEEIVKNKEVLEAILDGRDPYSGETLNEFYEKSVQSDLLGKLKTSAKVLAYIKQEMALFFKFSKFMDADDMYRSSKGSTTGGREDVYFLYDDCGKAEKKAKAVGSEVKEIEGRCGVGLGLKRSEKGGKVKGGELGSIQRLVDLAIKNHMDKDIEPGFYKKADDLVFDGDMDRKQRAQQIIQNTEDKVASVVGLLGKAKTYKDSDGNEFTTNPSEIGKNMINQISELLGPEALEQSPLAEILYDVDEKGNRTPVDLSGDDEVQEENRLRVAEAVGRLVRFDLYRKGLESDKEATSDALKYQAFLTGGNARDMAQFVGADSGDVKVFAQNECLTSAFKDGSVEVDGQGIKFTGKDGTEVRWSQERTKTSSGPQTRSVLSMGKDAIAKHSSGDYSVDIQKEEKGKIDDAFEVLLKSQIALLEGLLLNKAT